MKMLIVSEGPESEAVNRQLHCVTLEETFRLAHAVLNAGRVPGEELEVQVIASPRDIANFPDACLVVCLNERSMQEASYERIHLLTSTKIVVLTKGLPPGLIVLDRSWMTPEVALSLLG